MILSEAFRKNPPVTTTCLLGVSDEAEVLYDHEMRAIPGLRWVPAVSRPKNDWRGFRGRVTDYLRSLAGDFPWLETEFYLCGSGAMIDEVKQTHPNVRIDVAPPLDRHPAMVDILLDRARETACKPD